MGGKQGYREIVAGKQRDAAVLPVPVGAGKRRRAYPAAVARDDEGDNSFLESIFLRARCDA